MYSVSLPSSYTKPNNQKKGSAQNLCIHLYLPNKNPLFFCKARSARSGAGVGWDPTHHSASSVRVSKSIVTRVPLPGCDAIEMVWDSLREISLHRYRPIPVDFLSMRPL